MQRENEFEIVEESKQVKYDLEAPMKYYAFDKAMRMIELEPLIAKNATIEKW